MLGSDNFDLFYESNIDFHVFNLTDGCNHKIIKRSLKKWKNIVNYKKIETNPNKDQRNNLSGYSIDFYTSSEFSYCQHKIYKEPQKFTIQVLINELKDLSANAEKLMSKRKTIL